jgi:hypothetical protein
MSRTAKHAEARKDKIKIQRDLISERSKKFCNRQSNEFFALAFLA